MKIDQKYEYIYCYAYRQLTISLIIFILTMVNGNTLYAQVSIYPEISKPCPNFTFANTSHFPDKKKSLKDFQGEYFILDFWGRYCAACIKSFPNSNSLQSKFNSKVRIILVGNQDKNNESEKLFEKIRANQNLNLSVAYDSTLHKRFVPNGLPYLVWINKSGIIKAITYSADLTEDHLNSFIADKDFTFTDASYEGLIKQKNNQYNYHLPFLVDGNGGGDTSFIFRSILAKWQKGMPTNYDSIKGLDKNLYNGAGFNFLRIPLLELYYMANFAQGNIPYPVYSKPLLQVKDSSPFNFSFAGEGKGLYCYSLQMPKNEVVEKRVMNIMRNDLRNYFPYNVNVEKRTLPCYVLKVVDAKKVDKLYADGDRKASNWDQFTGGKLINIPIEQFVKILGIRMSNGLRILNETGISHNITIQINAFLPDPKEVKKALAIYGLDIESTERKMEVLVIRDSKR